MAKKEGNSNFVKFVTVINLVGLILVGLLALHLVKVVKKIATIQASTAYQNNITNAQYNCDSGKKIQAIYFQDKVQLTLSDGRNLLLMQALSADGSRFTNGDESVVFWNTGKTAFIEEGPQDSLTYANCNQTATE